MLEFLASIAAILVAALPVGAKEETSPLLRREIKLGKCVITALSELEGPTADVRSPTPPAARTAFLVALDRRVYLIGPSARGAAIRRAMVNLGYRPSDIEAVIITTLDEDQATGLMDGEDAAYPTATVFVDRLAADPIVPRPTQPVAITKALRTYRALGRLQVLDQEIEISPGVRITVAPGDVRTGSVRVNCGTDTLAVWTGSIGQQGGTQTPERAARPQDRQVFLREAVARNYLIASPVGPFPGLGHAYLMKDGFHWGSIEAQSYKGVPLRRGQVFVEPADK